jgi:hypothetical protein
MPGNIPGNHVLELLSVLQTSSLHLQLTKEGNTFSLEYFQIWKQEKIT